MTWTAQLGSTILIPSGGYDHLHIVCSDPMDFEGRQPQSCLLLNISSVVARCDRTLVLTVGDHPFIQHDSFVYYKKAMIESAAVLQQNVVSGLYRAHQPANRLLVKRIIASMDASDFTSGEMVKAAAQVWNQTVW